MVPAWLPRPLAWIFAHVKRLNRMVPAWLPRPIAWIFAHVKRLKTSSYTHFSIRCTSHTLLATFGAATVVFQCWSWVQGSWENYRLPLPGSQHEPRWSQQEPRWSQHGSRPLSIGNNHTKNYKLPPLSLHMLAPQIGTKMDKETKRQRGKEATRQRDEEAKRQREQETRRQIAKETEHGQLLRTNQNIVFSYCTPTRNCAIPRGLEALRF